MDQELTLEILRLRQAQEQDAEKRWPERMANSTSTVCPLSDALSLRTLGDGAIRFDGKLSWTIRRMALLVAVPLTLRSRLRLDAVPTPHPDAHAGARSDCSGASGCSESSRAPRLRRGDGTVSGKPIERNAAAEVLVERGGELGIPFERAARAATSEASVAFSDAGTIAWLESQLGIPDESIGEPPKALKQYLEESKAALEAIVSALEREAPDWGRDEVDKKGTVNTPALTPSLRLQSVLLAAALIETRAGREIEAERLLEASWSLARPAAEAPMLITQLIGAQVGWVAGGRASEDAERSSRVDRSFLERPLLERHARCVRGGWRTRESPSLAPSSDPREEIERKAPAAIAAGLKKLGPCEGASLDDEGLWKLAERDLFPSSDPATVEARDVYREFTLPNMVRSRAARRSARRGPRAHAGDSAAPHVEGAGRRGALARADGDRGLDRVPVGGICLSSRCTGGMEIRFEGAAPAPNAQFLLPLSFRGAAGPKPTASPTPTSAPLTPTPAGGMIAPQ